MTNGEPERNLRDRLERLGYVVPLIVIRSWPKKARMTGQICRRQVERWAIRAESKNGRRVAFPQILAQFDVQIQRKKKRLAQSVWKNGAPFYDS